MGTGSRGVAPGGCRCVVAGRPAGGGCWRRRGVGAGTGAGVRAVDAHGRRLPLPGTGPPAAHAAVVAGGPADDGGDRLHLVAVVATGDGAATGAAGVNRRLRGDVDADPDAVLARGGALRAGVPGRDAGRGAGRDIERRRRQAGGRGRHVGGRRAGAVGRRPGPGGDGRDRRRAGADDVPPDPERPWWTCRWPSAGPSTRRRRVPSRNSTASRS